MELDDNLHNLKVENFLDGSKWELGLLKAFLPADIVILRFAKEWIDSCLKRSESRSNITKCISWQPPENEWVKVNVDGSMRGDSRDIAAGGLIRDGHRNPGSIFLGLNLSWNQDYKQVILEV
ncbi:hypothetical protein ACOSQ4_001641 [Xanthoceras sorbifolium]